MRQAVPILVSARFMACFMACAIALAGCSIRQEVQPMAEQSEEAICIIEDPAVRSGFFSAYVQVLRERGYEVRILPKNSAVNTCPLTTTYIGYWKWDMAIYLAEARIEVFRNGQLAGKAEYNSRSGPANMKKFVNGEAKVRELAESLFPARVKAAQ